MHPCGEAFTLISSPVNGQRHTISPDNGGPETTPSDVPSDSPTSDSRAGRRVLTAAGWFWCAYGAWILIAGWLRPPEFWLVTYGPPMTCFAYGVGLLHRDRYALWLGWVWVGLLVAGAAVTDLLQERSSVAFIAAQIILAAYTTWVRNTLRANARGDIAGDDADAESVRFRFFYLAVCAWIIHGDQSAREAALVSVQMTAPKDRRRMLGFLEDLPHVVGYEIGGRLVSDVVDQFKQSLESAGRGMLTRFTARRRLRTIDREYANALKVHDAAVFLRRHPQLAETE